MNKPATKQRRGSAVPINGPALREIRVRSGIEIDAMAAALDITSAYVSKIELGYSPRVSTTVFNGIMRVLGIRDQRVLRTDMATDAA